MQALLQQQCLQLTENLLLHLMLLLLLPLLQLLLITLISRTCRATVGVHSQALQQQEQQISHQRHHSRAATAVLLTASLLRWQIKQLQVTVGAGLQWTGHFLFPGLLFRSTLFAALPGCTKQQTRPLLGCQSQVQGNKQMCSMLVAVLQLQGSPCWMQTWPQRLVDLVHGMLLVPTHKQNLVGLFILLSLGHACVQLPFTTGDVCNAFDVQPSAEQSLPQPVLCLLAVVCCSSYLSSACGAHITDQ